MAPKEKFLIQRQTGNASPEQCRWRDYKTKLSFVPGGTAMHGERQKV